MSVEYNINTYGSSKGILVFPDHYVAVAQVFEKGHALAVTTPEGRKIIKAGTPYPSNDANAIGLVFNDLDVTDGDRTGAILIHGFVATAKLPVIVSADARAAMRGIHFLPVVSPGPVELNAIAPEVASGTAKDTVITVPVTIANATFREEAGNLDKWTITNENTTKLKVDSITVAPGGKYILVTLKATAATEAGSVTIKPSADVISLGVAPTDAVTVATVAAAQQG